MQCSAMLCSAMQCIIGWCHPRKIVACCENCFCHNLKINKVKYIKVTFLEREFHKESIKIVRYLANK